MKRRVRLVRRLLLGAVVLMALVAGALVLARFSDGPIGPLPGGKLHGPVAREPVTDWSPVVAGAGHLELEVDPAHPRSITTSYIVHDGKLYVPSMFAAHKRWPQHVLADDRVVLRIGGKLYERRAVRVTDPAELRPLVRAHDGATDGADPRALSTWYFRIDPRTP
jgi:hypothetical protein